MTDHSQDPQAETGSLGESDEVINHHIEIHRASCGRWEITEFGCPCGEGRIFICSGCHQPVAAGRYGDAWCACIRKIDAAARAMGDTSLRLL